MYFFIEDDGLLEKHNTISNKVSPGIKKYFGSESLFTIMNI